MLSETTYYVPLKIVSAMHPIMIRTCHAAPVVPGASKQSMPSDMPSDMPRPAMILGFDPILALIPCSQKLDTAILDTQIRHQYVYQGTDDMTIVLCADFFANEVLACQRCSLGLRVWFFLLLSLCIWPRSLLIFRESQVAPDFQHVLAHCDYYILQ